MVSIDFTEDEAHLLVNLIGAVQLTGRPGELQQILAQVAQLQNKVLESLNGAAEATEGD